MLKALAVLQLDPDQTALEGYILKDFIFLLEDLEPLRCSFSVSDTK